MTKRSFHRIVFAVFGIAAAFLFIAFPQSHTAAVDKDKLTAQEIVVKHLDSIGPATTRSTIKTREVIGTCKFTAKISTGGTSFTDGPAVLASDGPKSLIAVSFSSLTYPFEKLGYDGKKLTAGYIRPGLRSTLGDFLITQSVSFKEGLMSGALSSAWPFWDLSGHDARLETAGTKKINGRDAYGIRYAPKKGSDFDIKLYFDAETFQHVRTEYSRTISAGQALTPELSSKQAQTRYSMSEDFSGFKKENGLNLPHSYKLEISLDGQAGTSVQTWEFEFNQFIFNEPIDPVSFNMEAAPATK
jgi:hypothetical protein